jgi:glycosyltransferase involved in cell wall biosynthesis
VGTSQESAAIAIFIPAYNAASTIATVLDRIPQEVRSQVAEIFVIDNNSSDGTGITALNFARAQGIENLEVIRNPENLGYGGSQKVAYRRCIEKGYDCVAMLHGDAQYAPQLLSTLIGPVVRGEADMVFGSRMSGDPRGGGMPLIRYLGNRLLTTVQNLLLGTRLSEFHSGYRVFSVEALKELPFDRLSSDYHFDTEVIILFINGRLRIKEIPIPTHYGDEKSHVNIWDYGLRVLVTTITFFLHIRRIRRSKNWRRILGA